MEINKTYEKTVSLIDNRDLKKAFDSLKTVILSLNLHIFEDKLNSIQDTYQRMLYYFAEGSKDPMQATIYNEIVSSAYELTDSIFNTLKKIDSSDVYYSVKRILALDKINLPKLIDNINSSYYVNNLKGAESNIFLLFKYIWTSAFLSEDEISALGKSLAANELEARGATILNCQIVSSLILALHQCFDIKKLLLLFDASNSSDEEVKIRVYTGILLTLYIYRNRIDCYPEIKNRMEALAETESFKKTVYYIIQRFIMSRETEKISSQLRDEILPEMMKLNPQFQPYLSPKDITPEQIENEMNPEWIEKFANTEIGKKLMEINKLQEEGADIMHFSFVHLKSFPFFNEISNWFVPFIKDDISLMTGEKTMTAFELIISSGLICNSDMYSLFFGINQIPESGRTIMLNQLEGQLSEVKEQRSEELQTKNNIIERISGRYIQDLYRFFKLYPRRKEFKDIFEMKLDFYNIPLLKPYFSETEELHNIAELNLSKNYFEEALSIYDNFTELVTLDEMVFQKKGYCKQMLGNFKGAIEDYLKAEMINSESKWLQRRIAQCYKSLHDTEQALNYYFKLELLDPENIPVLMNIGSCYLEMKDYNKALGYYFKVDYLDNEGQKSWRPIAWCSFLCGRYDQARNYYSKILSENPDSQDYINAGHTEWVLRNIKKTIEYYVQSITGYESDFDKFMTAFNADISVLENAGIDISKIPLVLDKVRYSL
jgi:tetratricopeptide (TPR) repeat protein